MYDTLDEVPWNSGTVTAVACSDGRTVGLDANHFAVWLTGPRAGQRIPLDAGGPWTPDPPEPLDTEIPVPAEEASAALAYCDGLDDAKMWTVRVAAAMDMLRMDIEGQGYNVPTADEAVAEVYRMKSELHEREVTIMQLRLELNGTPEDGDAASAYGLR